MKKEFEKAQDFYYRDIEETDFRKVEIEILGSHTFYPYDDGYMIDIVLKIDDEKDFMDQFCTLVSKIYNPMYYAAHDCTGQHFTADIKAIHFDDIWQVLTVRHRVSIDI
jgi:hypothetical protein